MENVEKNENTGRKNTPRSGKKRECEIVGNIRMRNRGNVEMWNRDNEAIGRGLPAHFNHTQHDARQMWECGDVGKEACNTGRSCNKGQDETKMPYNVREETREDKTRQEKTTRLIIGEKIQHKIIQDERGQDKTRQKRTRQGTKPSQAKPSQAKAGPTTPKATPVETLKTTSQPLRCP